MLKLNYNIVDDSKKFSLAGESWKEISQFLSSYQWAFDEPKCSPRKTEIIHAILNKGKPGACTFFRPEGYKYILHPLNPNSFEQAIANHRKVYYVSYGRKALPYFDIDLHYEYQTWEEGEQAKQLIDAYLEDFFGQPVLFWAPSNRGLNGYLKVDLQGERYSQANDLFARLEKSLQLFLAQKENLADFEIKGRLGYLSDGQYHWAHYGKLPIHAPDWSFPRLAQFKATPTVRLQALRTVCARLESSIPATVLTNHKLYKKALGDAPFRDGHYFRVTPEMEQALVEKHGEDWPWLFQVREEDDGKVWLHQRYYRPGALPLTENERIEAGRQTPVPCQENILVNVFQQMEADHSQEEDQMKCNLASILERVEAGQETEPRRHDHHERVHHREEQPRLPRPKNLPDTCVIGVYIADLLTEPDTFKRQLEALRRLARYLKRVPTQEEAMAFLKEKKLYSGSWGDNLGNRERRVQDILRFIAQTFDPAKCAKGSVNVGKYDAWAKKAFPDGLSGQLRGGMNEYMQPYPGATVHVNPAFISVFMSVVEFALLTDKNQDNSLPHNRGEELWTALNTAGQVSLKFDARKWAVCRDQLEKYGIITIIDRHYFPGQGMKWDVGTYFPFLGLWKTPKLRSLLGPGSLPTRMRRTTEQHNTLLQLQSPPSAVLCSLNRSRPPPGAINSS